MSPQLRNALSLAQRLLLFFILGIASIFLIKAGYAWDPLGGQKSNGRNINGKPLADKESPSERESFTDFEKSLFKNAAGCSAQVVCHD